MQRKQYFHQLRFDELRLSMTSKLTPSLNTNRTTSHHTPMTSSSSPLALETTRVRPRTCRPINRTSEKQKMSSRTPRRRNQAQKVASISPPPQKQRLPNAVAFNKVLQHLVRSKSRKNKQSPSGLAKQAQDLLLARIEKNQTDYDTVSFNIVLQAWAREHSMAAAEGADRLLSILLQSPSCQADSYSWAAVLHAYAKSEGKLLAARRAQELLEQWMTLPSSFTGLPTDVCHNAVIDAWAVSGDERAGERAEALLRQLECRGRPEDSDAVLPTLVSYNACIKAYARAGRAQDAQRLLDELRNSTTLHPDKISYATCMDAWAKSSENDAAERSERLLSELEQEWVESQDPRVRPDVVAYTSVLHACSKQPQANPPTNPMELLERMNRFAQENPNATFLNAWIHLLSKTARQVDRKAGVAQAAEEILDYMRVEYEKSQNELMRPCVITYTSVINVLAQTGTVQSAERAEALLHEMTALWRRTGDMAYLPNAKTFASVLNAWAKSGAEGILERAYRLLDQMKGLYNETQVDQLRPNMIVYSLVFQILASSPDTNAGVRAKELLKEMNDLHKAGFSDVRPDAGTYATLINTFTKSGVENAAEIATRVLAEVEAGYQAGNGELKPTPLLYSAVLQACAKSSSPKGAKLAQELLERNKSMYKQGKLYTKPTTLHYNAVIDALARSGGGRAAAMQAEELVNELESRCRAGDAALQPRSRTFNAAILAWRNSNADDAPDRAEALLRRLNELYKAGNVQCQPDRVTLNSVIGVWAKSKQKGAAERAHSFLKLMLQTSGGGNNSTSSAVDLKPDSFSFNSCIDAYSRSGRPDAAQKIVELYEQMERLYSETGDDGLKPDRITRTLLRSAWLRCSRSKNLGSVEDLRRLQKLAAEVEGCLR